LNRVWQTSFQTWDEVRPMPYGEAFLHPSPAPWVEHRLYMDLLFARTLQTKRQALLQKYPGALIGPTGVNNPPHVYGGNWNFWNMRVFDCASYYGVGRIPLSFDREQRLIMQYRGYNSPENVTVTVSGRGCWLANAVPTTGMARPSSCPTSGRRKFASTTRNCSGNCVLDRATFFIMPGKLPARSPFCIRRSR
jgi:hypothetical protein